MQRELFQLLRRIYLTIFQYPSHPKTVNYNIHQIFKDLLLKIEWSQLYKLSNTGVNEMWYFFSDKFAHSFRKASPLMTIDVSKQRRMILTTDIQGMEEYLNISFVLSKYRFEFVEEYKNVKHLYDAALNLCKQTSYPHTTPH